MRSSFRILGCWDIVTGEEVAPLKPNPFYTSWNRPTGVKSLRLAEVEYARCDDNGNYIHSDEACKERVLEIKDQVAGYESYTRLREKALNMIMGSISMDLWHQCTNRDDPSTLWKELRNYYTVEGTSNDY